jgi:hypothetical protein
MAASVSARERRGSFPHRLEVASRVLAAIVGGFLVVSGVATLIAAALTGRGAQTRGSPVYSGT